MTVGFGRRYGSSQCTTVFAVCYVLLLSRTFGFSIRPARTLLEMRKRPLPIGHQGAKTICRDRSSNDDQDQSVEIWSPFLRKIIGVIATVGFLETAYMAGLPKLNTDSLVCSSKDCSSILSGPYATVPGTRVPLATIGLIAYIGVLLLALYPLLQKERIDDNCNRLALTTLTTSMGVFSVVLVTLSLLVIKGLCPLCVLSAILSVLLAIIPLFGGCVQTNARAMSSIVGVLAAFAMAVFMFVRVGDPMVSSPDMHASVAVPATSKNMLLSAVAGFRRHATPIITTSSTRRALALTKSLKELDARLLGAYWCSHCHEQKQILGKQAMANIPYIECSSDLHAGIDLCDDAEVPGYPTWKIDGRLFPGVKSMEELERIVHQQHQLQ